ncbi:MAG: ATP--guanido phosphotransferase, partial [Verrucomicrobiota bacterium]|nr:ATP--guanido phosphotransferase [Verrucomicrobiota bacterium]
MNGRSSTGPEAFAGVEQREHGIILSSRVRLARNLQDLAFPPQAAAGVLDEVCLRVEAVLCKGAPLFEKLGKASPRRLQELFEEHLISRDLLKHRPGAAIRMNAEGRHSVMVNEEDHLRIQVLLPGLALRRAWEEADRLDDELEQRLDYAFSPSLGYLTSCPSNVGTGMRASVLMHLPGLVMMREMEPIMNGL